MSQGFKVMLHGTIRKDYFKRNTALQFCNIIGLTGNNRAIYTRKMRRVLHKMRLK